MNQLTSANFPAKPGSNVRVYKIQEGATLHRVGGVGGWQGAGVGLSHQYLLSILVNK
jgi:hypothetical protein